MSDLISRSELLKRFCITKDGHRIPERDCDNFEITISIKDVKAIINEQQKAYDIDKVISEFNEKVENHGGEDYYVEIGDAVEIVKRGGVADDVCKELVWYRFKTKSVDDYRPLIDMKEIQMPYWCTGTAFDNSYVTIVCFLPKGEDLYKYWDDAYDIESDERTGITYTDRFPRPNWIKPEDGDSIDCSCMYIDRSRV